MAHVKSNVRKGESVFGSSKGSRGAVYYHTTDGAGVISCTCPDFMSGKTAKGTAVEDRVCKHLRKILAGDYTDFTPAAKAGSARALADEIKAELEEAEKDLAAANPRSIMSAIKKFNDVKSKSQAFTDKLKDEIEEITNRLETAQRTAQERL